MSLTSSLYPGAKKAHRLILVTLFSQEKLQAALKKLRKEHTKVEELEADIKEKRVSWKAGRDISWGSSETENGQHLGPVTRMLLPLCYFRINEFEGFLISLHFIPSLLGIGCQRVDISWVKPNIGKWRHEGNNKNDSWIPCPISIIKFAPLILPENTLRKA